MHVDIDKYASLNSLIHNWDTRFKIISLMSAIVAISMLKTIELALCALFITSIITIISNIPVRFMLQKIKYPSLFLLPLFLFLPLTSGGKIITQFDYIHIYFDGIYISSLILVKAITIMTFFIIMLGTSSFNQSTKALLVLKIPRKLVNLLLFTYRYIFVYMETLRKMRLALTLRGYKSANSIKSIRNTANLVGSILVRSFEHTDRVYNAMILRGFEEDVIPINDFKYKISDVLKSITIISFFVVIVICDILVK